VLRVDDSSRCGGDPAPCFYGFSTEAGFLGLLNVPVIRSSDLTNWLWAGPPASGSTAARKDAMPTLAPWVQFGRTWAPSVMVNPTNPNQYVMHYTAWSKAAATNGRQCIGVATSSAPDGPYVDNSSTPLTCPGSGDVIDPSTFTDGSGGLWLLYTDPIGIKAQPLAPNGLSLTGSPTQILSATQSWENGRVEAPSMFQTATTGILLLYSGNNFNVPGYAVGAVRCTSPTACTTISSSPVLTNSSGPGGQSPFLLGDGTTWRVAYHAWTGGGATGLRTLRIGSMTFSGSSPNQVPVITP
jgi:beta-xylosidase